MTADELNAMLDDVGRVMAKLETARCGARCSASEPVDAAIAALTPILRTLHDGYLVAVRREAR